MAVTVEYQRRWRLADEKGRSVAEGFTSPAKARQWAEEQGHEVRRKWPPIVQTRGRFAPHIMSLASTSAVG